MGDTENRGDGYGKRAVPVLEVLAMLMPVAVGVIVAPVPIIVAIVFAGSRRGGVKAPAFAAGWFTGVLVVTLLLSLVGAGGETPPFVYWVNVVLGLVLWWLAAREYRNRDKKELPSWMTAVNDLKPSRAALAGLALATVGNPKSLPLGASAGVVVAEADLGAVGTFVACLIFAAISSVGMVLVAVLRFTTGGAAVLDRLKVWLADHGPAITVPLFLVLGMLIITDSLDAIRGS